MGVVDTFGLCLCKSSSVCVAMADRRHGHDSIIDSSYRKVASTVVFRFKHVWFKQEFRFHFSQNETMFDLSKIFGLSKKFALSDTFIKSKNYCTSPSCFEAHGCLFRLLMKGIFDTWFLMLMYCDHLSFLFELVTHINTRDFTVFIWKLELTVTYFRMVT